MSAGHPNIAPAVTPARRPFHLMAKPSGSACNLDCTYCFYLEKQKLYPDSRQRMSDEILEAYTRSYLQAHPAGQPVVFAWQGGEPTLLGLDFYRRALALQQQYGKGRQIQNTFQTNGTLLTDEWCRFLAQHDFLVGLSLDGPAEIHDHYRLGKDGKATHARVLQALELLKQHRVQYNVLACVNRLSSQHPLEVYHFLREHGVEFVQFIPIVERPPQGQYVQLGLTHSGPTPLQSAATRTSTISVQPETMVTQWSVLPEDYGKFLAAIFAEWVTKDVGRVFVMNFEWALAAYMDAPGAVCVHQPTCGSAAIMEHNGDVYSCDHYVYPEYRLGNILEKSLTAMMQSPEQSHFGHAKEDALPKQCRECRVLKACWGGCPKHRFVAAADGRGGLNYLCKGYTHFFTAILPHVKAFAELIRAGRDPAEIMHLQR